MKKLFVVLVLFAIAAVPAATATTFTLTGVNISAQSTDLGLVIHTGRDSDDVALNTSWTLTPGQTSDPFKLFDIWTNESAVNSDDTSPKTITVQFTFNPPPSPTGSDTGETVGALTGFLDLFQQGQVTWNTPTHVFYGLRRRVLSDTASYNVQHRVPFTRLWPMRWC